MTDAIQIARLDRARDRLQSGALSRRKTRQLRRRAIRAVGAMSLDGFVAWINRDAQGFALMGADSWRAQGVTTAAALGAILDREARREREEAEREAYWD